MTTTGTTGHTAELQAAVTEAADNLETLGGHLERYHNAPSRLAAHLEASHGEGNASAAIYTTGAADHGGELWTCHLGHHAADTAADTAALASAQEALATWQGDDPDAAECAICVPGQCPGPDCPGYLGGPEFATCPNGHGDQEVTAEGGFTGYAGGRCYTATLACGCQIVDESADIAAAI
jgi:hypothetical protein